MSRRGPMAIEDHRAWVAKFGEWTPPKGRPGDKLVERVMGQLGAALDAPDHLRSEMSRTERSTQPSSIAQASAQEPVAEMESLQK